MADDAAPQLSVIVPARDEARNITRCLTSLLESDYPRLEIVVVDDRSSDGTAEIVSRLAGGDARVRLLRGADLPTGWFGKPWACQQGLDAARGELLLFTDADTWHGPRLHRLAVAAMLAEGADLLTLMPRVECETFWERLLQPQFLALLGLRFFPAGWLHRIRDPRDAIANGQFILVTRESYQAVGGHEAVRDQVAEDLSLAQHYVREGRLLRFAFAQDDLRVRMYTSLREIADGWTKNLYSGVRRTVPHPVMAAPALLVTAIVWLGWLAPPLVLAWALATGRGNSIVWAAAATGVALAGWAGLLAYARIPVRYALLHPVGAVFAAAILLRSLWRGTRRIEWKGRTYDGSHALPVVRDEAPAGDHRHH